MNIAKLASRALIGAALSAVLASAALAQSFPGSGAQPVSRGATGRAALTQNNLLFGNGTAPVGFLSPASLPGRCVISNGTSWVAQYCLVTGQIVGTAPVTVNVATGVATVALTIDANFAVISNQLGLASIPSGTLIANAGAGSAEPTQTTLTLYLDRAIGSTNGQFPARIGGTWSPATFGTGLAFSGSAVNLQPAAAGTIGGVNSIAQVASQWVQYIDTLGAPHLAQPAFSNLSGSATCAQLPALTGNVTTTAGNCNTAIATAAVTYAMIQNVAASRLWGNPTGSPAAGSEISLGATLAFVSTTLQTGAGTGDVAWSANSFTTTIQPAVVTNAKLANMLANTIKGNGTGSPATPTDLSVPSCSTASSALIWTSGTGFGCNTITGAGGGTNTQTANYTVATMDCGKTIQAGTGSTGFFTVTFPAVAGFSTTCTVDVVNGDTGRGKTVSGLGNAIMCWPLQRLTAQIINGAWFVSKPCGRWRPPNGTAVTFFTDFTNGSDTLNTSDGLATGTGNAFKTANHGLYVALANLDFDGNDAGQTSVVVRMADNTTDTTGVHLSAHDFVGMQGGLAITLQGGTNSVLSTAGGVTAVDTYFSTVLHVQNLTLAAAAGGHCASANFHAHIYLNNVTFGACSGAMINVQTGSHIELAGSVTVNAGTSGEFLLCQGMSTFSTVGQSITLTGNITVTNFAQSESCHASFGGTAITLGAFSVTGKRYTVQYNGLLFSATGTPATYFPGTVAGTVATQGQAF
jgi:hypothetical protein